jgi:hypothetical protein
LDPASPGWDKRSQFLSRRPTPEETGLDAAQILAICQLREHHPGNVIVSTLRAMPAAGKSAAARATSVASNPATILEKPSDQEESLASKGGKTAF